MINRAVWILALLAAGPALGDGFFAPKLVREDVKGTPAAVTSAKQEAILATDGKTVQVVLRTHYNQGPGELAWVVPVPGKPSNIKASDDDAFSRLDLLTAPRFYTYRFIPHTSLMPKFGCGVDGPEEVAVQQPVTVVESGTAGMYDYTVLSATDAGALAKWLTDHNYALPPKAAEVFAKYDQQGWHWLAMRLRSGKQAIATLAPHPISYTYTSDKLVFPLIISQLSAAKENEIVLCVVSESFHTAGGWSHRRVDHYDGWDFLQNYPIRPDSKSPSGTTYEAMVRRATKDNGGHLLVKEFAQTWEIFGYSPGIVRRVNDVVDHSIIDVLGSKQHVERFRAFVMPEHMDRDIEFTADPNQRGVDNNIRTDLPLEGDDSFTSSNRGAAMSAVPLGLAGLGLGCRRRLRHGATIFLILACVGIAML